MNNLRKVMSAVFAAMLILITPGTAQATWSIKEIIPLYVYPDWYNTGNDWVRACNEVNPAGIGSMLVANSATNGPTSSYNQDYATVIGYCHQKGHNVLGYVDTSYGAVPLEDVFDDIDAWFDQYDGDRTNAAQWTGSTWVAATTVDTTLDGIFLDQVNNFPASYVTGETNMTVQAYYDAVWDHFGSVAPAGYDHLQLNPGAAASTDWQLHDYSSPVTQIGDAATVFEGTYASYMEWDPPSWVTGWADSDISVMVYDTELAEVADVCEKALEDGAGWVTITNYTITENATPWNFYPSSTYMAEVRQECG